MKSWRLPLLFLAGAVLAGVAVWRQSQLELWRETRPAPRIALPRPAPDFVISDEHQHVVKLSGYLGRHSIILLFIDGSLPEAHEDPLLRQLIACHAALKSAGYVVLAVRPDQPRPFRMDLLREEAGGEIPFPILRDIHPDPQKPVVNPAHAAWGLLDPVSGETRGGLFLIDRKGEVRGDQNGELVPETDPAGKLRELCGE